MRSFLMVVLAASAGFAFQPALASGGLATEILEHGGGCRKSSPPGKCCHMDNRTGVVHCH